MSRTAPAFTCLHRILTVVSVFTCTAFWPDHTFLLLAELTPCNTCSVDAVCRDSTHSLVQACMMLYDQQIGTCGTPGHAEAEPMLPVGIACLSDSPADSAVGQADWVQAVATRPPSCQSSLLSCGPTSPLPSVRCAPGLPARCNCSGAEMVPIP